MNLTRATRRIAVRKHLRTHAAYEGKPLCGGGNGARSVNWQLDLAPCNCKACQKILGGGAE